MRLFGALLRRRNKFIKPVTPKDIHQLRLDLEIEEQNMFYLRHAYLTPEQSSGHAQALGKQDARYMKTVVHKEKKWYNNVSLENRLAHLRHGEAWDV